MEMSKLRKPGPDGRHRRRARHQGRIARQDLHRRSAGARRLRAALRQGRAVLRNPRHPAASTVVVVRFKGVNDRNAAEALTGTELFVDRSALPDEGDEDEFYHADLVGLAVQGRERSRDRQGDRGAEFRRRRHSGDRARRQERRADPVHAGRRAGGRHRRQASSASTPSLPGWSRRRRRRTTRPAERRLRSGTAPRGPKDAGGNR